MPSDRGAGGCALGSRGTALDGSTNAGPSAQRSPMHSVTRGLCMIVQVGCVLSAMYWFWAFWLVRPHVNQGLFRPCARLVARVLSRQNMSFLSQVWQARCLGLSVFQTGFGEPGLPGPPPPRHMSWAVGLAGYVNMCLRVFKAHCALSPPFCNQAVAA